MLSPPLTYNQQRHAYKERAVNSKGIHDGSIFTIDSLRTLLQNSTSLPASSLSELGEPTVLILHYWFLALKTRNWFGIWPNRQWWQLSLLVCVSNREWLDGHISLPVQAKSRQWLGSITVCSSQEPTVISLHHKKVAAFLSFLLSSIPRTKTRVWALPFIVAAALHHEASACILKNGLIFLL